MRNDDVKFDETIRTSRTGSRTETASRCERSTSGSTPSRRPRKAPSRGDEAAPGIPGRAASGTVSCAAADERDGHGGRSGGGSPRARRRWAESSRTPDAASQAVQSTAARFLPSHGAVTPTYVRAGDRVRCAADCRVYLVHGFPAGLTPRSVVLFPERPADGRWGAGSRLVWRGLRPSPR